MESVQNLFFIIIFFMFVFYWFTNIMENKSEYIYIPYSKTN